MWSLHHCFFYFYIRIDFDSIYRLIICQVHSIPLLKSVSVSVSSLSFAHSALKSSPTNINANIDEKQAPVYLSAAVDNVPLCPTACFTKVLPLKVRMISSSLRFPIPDAILSLSGLYTPFDICPGLFVFLTDAMSSSSLKYSSST